MASCLMIEKGIKNDHVHHVDQTHPFIAPCCGTVIVVEIEVIERYVSHQGVAIPTVGRSQAIKPVERYAIHVMRALDVRQRHVAEGVLGGRGGYKACYLDASRVPDAIHLPTRGISLVDAENVVDVN